MTNRNKKISESISHLHKLIEDENSNLDANRKAGLLNDIASLYAKQTNHDVALKYYQESLFLRQKTGDQ